MKKIWIALALTLSLLPRHAPAAQEAAVTLPEGEVELTDVASPEEIWSEMLQNGSAEDLSAMELAPPAGENAKLYILVSKAQQHLWVYEDGKLIPGWDWPVSTATEKPYCDGTGGACGFAHTPTGVRHPGRLDWIHYSAAFDNAAMHRAIQFGPTGGIFLHATYGNHIALLGHRASHGCIRQLPANAERLFKLVQSIIDDPNYGRAAVDIEVTESAIPDPADYLTNPQTAPPAPGTPAPPAAK
jgi:L,D-transpeptidase catalytic domain